MHDLSHPNRSRRWAISCLVMAWQDQASKNISGLTCPPCNLCVASLAVWWQEQHKSQHFVLAQPADGFTKARPACIYVHTIMQENSNVQMNWGSIMTHSAGFPEFPHWRESGPLEMIPRFLRRQEKTYTCHIVWGSLTTEPCVSITQLSWLSLSTEFWSNQAWHARAWLWVECGSKVKSKSSHARYDS